MGSARQNAIFGQNFRKIALNGKVLQKVEQSRAKKASQGTTTAFCDLKADSTTRTLPLFFFVLYFSMIVSDKSRNIHTQTCAPIQ